MNTFIPRARERESESESESERHRERENERERTRERERAKQRERERARQRERGPKQKRIQTTSHLPEVKGHVDDLLGDEELSRLPWPTCLSERRGKLESPTREKEKRAAYF